MLIDKELKDKDYKVRKGALMLQREYSLRQPLPPFLDTFVMLVNPPSLPVEMKCIASATRPSRNFPSISANPTGLLWRRWRMRRSRRLKQSTSGAYLMVFDRTRCVLLTWFRPFQSGQNGQNAQNGQTLQQKPRRENPPGLKFKNRTSKLETQLTWQDLP